MTADELIKLMIDYYAACDELGEVLEREGLDGAAVGERFVQADRLWARIVGEIKRVYGEAA